MQVKEKMSILYYSTVYIKDFHLTAKTTSYISIFHKFSKYQGWHTDDVNS